MAQTTCLVSFGPISTVLTHPVTYFVSKTYIYHKSLVSIKNNRRKIKKNSPRAQTTHLASFAPQTPTSWVLLDGNSISNFLSS